MDSVRTGRRLGASQAIIVYRRGREELPARAEEVHHAEEEGVRFELLSAPLEVLGDEDGWVTGLRCERMELGERTTPGGAGRSRWRAQGSSSIATWWSWPSARAATRCSPPASRTCGSTSGAILVVDEDGMTSVPGVFAGGDIVRVAATVILAMGDGKGTAGAIGRYLDRVAGSREALAQGV